MDGGKLGGTMKDRTQRYLLAVKRAGIWNLRDERMTSVGDMRRAKRGMTSRESAVVTYTDQCSCLWFSFESPYFRARKPFRGHAMRARTLLA